MKTICIYHKNCFDGICAAWVVSKVYPDAKFISMDYSMKIQDIIRPIIDRFGEQFKCIMVDFSLQRDDMIWLSGCGDLTVIDHHKTAQANCEGLSFCHFDMNESGASLVWKYFYPDKDIPVLVRYIKDRDLWKFEERYSEPINCYIQSHPMTISQYKLLSKELEQPEGFSYALAGGQSILRYKNQMVEMQAKSAMIMNIAGYEVPVANATAMFSEVGNLLCKQFPDYPFSAYFADKPDGIRQWGLRSIGDFDVSEIAKKYGGGGHKNAAGFNQKIGRITAF